MQVSLVISSRDDTIGLWATVVSVTLAQIYITRY